MGRVLYFTAYLGPIAPLKVRATAVGAVLCLVRNLLLLLLPLLPMLLLLHPLLLLCKLLKDLQLQRNLLLRLLLLRGQCSFWQLRGAAWARRRWGL